MAKTRRTRWVCPSCGKGKLGPQRPRKDNVVRWCLPCSAKTGKLVERSAPSLEKKAEEKADAAKTRRAAKKAKADEKWIVHGFDLRAVLRVLWRSKTMKAARTQAKLPALSITRAKNTRHLGSSGHASPWKHSIHVTINPRSGPMAVLQLLAHEVAHLGPVIGRRGSREWHGADFRARLADLCIEVFGVDKATAYQKNIDTRKAYAFDGELVRLMVPHTAAIRERFDAPEPPKADPKKRKPPTWVIDWHDQEAGLVVVTMSTSAHDALTGYVADTFPGDDQPERRDLALAIRAARPIGRTKRYRMVLAEALVDRLRREADYARSSCWAPEDATWRRGAALVQDAAAYWLAGKLWSHRGSGYSKHSGWSGGIVREREDSPTDG